MNNKNKKIIIISVIALFLVLGIGLTYAYFKSQIDNGDKKNVDVTSDTTDQLLFNVDNNINLSINQFNFGPGSGDLVSESKATASLRANSVENNATYNYYVYFYIGNNAFLYTTTDKKTEILLQITDPTGNKVTSIEGLKYDNTLEGFDITTASGLFEVAKSYEITSTSSTDATIQEWNFTAKFINLDSDQEANTGKSMNGIIYIRRDELTEFKFLSNYIKELYTENGINNLYHHDGKLENSINDGSFRYSGTDARTIKAEYSEIYKALKKTSATTEAPLISFMCGDTESYIGATCTEKIQYYFLAYDTDKTQYDHPNKAIEQAIKDGYVEREYVNNFVCFGSEEAECPIDNLYRIIGVFRDKVKLIKFDYANENLLGVDGDRGIDDLAISLTTVYYKGFNKTANGYYWNKTNYDATLEKYTESGATNIWEESALNKINLNTNYLNNIGETWANKIALTDWNVSGGLYASIRSTSPTGYQAEIGTSVDGFPKTYKAKIGLMYVSDYSYSRPTSYWTKSIANTKTCGSSWLTMGSSEWTISRFTDDSDNYKKATAYLSSGRYVGTYTGSYINAQMYGVRPVFYLNNDVTYKSGDGTYENPIRIEV